MPEAIEAKLQKQDLPPRDRKRVQDAVNTYYNLHVKFNKDLGVSKRKIDLFWHLFLQTPEQGIFLGWHSVLYICPASQDKTLKEEEKWSLFARILKNALDRNLGEHWHVAVGNGLGYLAMPCFLWKSLLRWSRFARGPSLWLFWGQQLETQVKPKSNYINKKSNSKP